MERTKYLEHVRKALNGKAPADLLFQVCLQGAMLSNTLQNLQKSLSGRVVAAESPDEVIEAVSTTDACLVALEFVKLSVQKIGDHTREAGCMRSSEIERAKAIDARPIDEFVRAAVEVMGGPR